MPKFLDEVRGTDTLGRTVQMIRFVPNDGYSGAIFARDVDLAVGIGYPYDQADETISWEFVDQNNNVTKIELSLDNNSDELPLVIQFAYRKSKVSNSWRCGAILIWPDGRQNEIFPSQHANDLPAITYSIQSMLTGPIAIYLSD